MLCNSSLQENHRSLAVDALERLIENTAHDEQALTALRSITRLQLTFMDEASNKEHFFQLILKYLQIGE